MKRYIIAVNVWEEESRADVQIMRLDDRTTHTQEIYWCDGNDQEPESYKRRMKGMTSLEGVYCYDNKNEAIGEAMTYVRDHFDDAPPEPTTTQSRMSGLD